MGTVHHLASRETASLGDAAAAYLATLDHPEKRGTRRVYATTLRAFVARFGATADLAGLEPRPVAAWFTERWGPAAPSTWNVNLDAIRSAQHYWHDQGWIDVIDLTAALRRRKRAADRSRALSRADIEALLSLDGTGLREKVFWSLAYESAARASEILGLDVADLDMPNRRAKVIRKGSAVDIITWRTGTARLLPRLLKGRRVRARVPHRPPGTGRATAWRRRPGERPRTPLVPPRCRAVRAGDRGPARRPVDASPAPPQRADARGRGRRQHSHTARLQRAHERRESRPVRQGERRGPGALAGRAGPGTAALTLDTRSSACTAQHRNQVREVWRDLISHAALAWHSRQWLDVLADKHQHRHPVHAPLGWDAPCLRRLVDHCGDLENGIKRIVACHDTARGGAVGQLAVRGHGQQVLHHAVQSAGGANVGLGQGHHPSYAS